MPTTSVPRAFQLKLAAMTAANFPGSVIPALYFDEAPQITGAGAQAQPTTQGYAVLKHRQAPGRAYAFGQVTREDCDIEIEIFYPELADCLAAALAMRLNGGTAQQKLGFDFGALSDLATSLTLLAIRPRGNAPSKAGLGKTGVPVHSWLLSYRVELVRGA